MHIIYHAQNKEIYRLTTIVQLSSIQIKYWPSSPSSPHVPCLYLIHQEFPLGTYFATQPAGSGFLNSNVISISADLETQRFRTFTFCPWPVGHAARQDSD